MRSSCLPIAFTLLHTYEPKSCFCRFRMVRFICQVYAFSSASAIMYFAPSCSFTLPAKIASSDRIRVLPTLPTTGGAHQKLGHRTSRGRMLHWWGARTKVSGARQLCMRRVRQTNTCVCEKCPRGVAIMLHARGQSPFAVYVVGVYLKLKISTGPTHRTHHRCGTNR